MCGFIIDKEFKDDESVQKSILMMQYLVTDQLNWVSMNWFQQDFMESHQKFVDIELGIDSVHLELCNTFKGVLKTAKQFTIETLRTTFLMREGILNQNEIRFNLKVTGLRYVDWKQLWNISIIQTTFMKID